MKAVVGVAGNESSPGDDISLGHFVEQVVCQLELAAFRVQVDEVIGDDEVRLVVGKVARTGGDSGDGGVRFVAVDEWGRWRFEGGEERDGPRELAERAEAKYAERDVIHPSDFTWLFFTVI